MGKDVLEEGNIKEEGTEIIEITSSGTCEVTKPHKTLLTLTVHGTLTYHYDSKTSTPPSPTPHTPLPQFSP